MTGAGPSLSDAVTSAVAALPSSGHRQSVLAVLEAVLARRPAGICVTGERGTGRTQFLRSLAAIVPANRVRLIWLDPDRSSPDHLAECLAEAEPTRAAGTARVVLVVPAAEALRRDTLDKLDEVAKGLRRQPRGLQLLLTGEPRFLTRLEVTRHLHLEFYLTRRIVLKPLTPAEAESYLQARLADMRPVRVLTEEQRALVLQTADGNPYLIRQALVQPAEALQTSIPRPKMRPEVRARAAALSALILAVVTGVGAGLAVHYRTSWLQTFGVHTSSSGGTAVPPPVPARSGRAGDTAAASPGPDAPHADPGPASPGPAAAERAAEPAPPAATADASPDLGDAAADDNAPEAGLIIIARSGDSLAGLYRRIYAGVDPPSFQQVVAANRMPIKPGVRVMFPRPPRGWGQAGAQPGATRRPADMGQ